MIKTIVKIEGMMCAMCEAHMTNAIKSEFNVKKVASSHEKNITVILSDAELDPKKLEETVVGAGYKFISASSAPYKKKILGLF